jgi:hypothetical protein
MIYTKQLKNKKFPDFNFLLMATAYHNTYRIKLKPPKLNFSTYKPYYTLLEEDVQTTQLHAKNLLGNQSMRLVA